MIDVDISNSRNSRPASVHLKFPVSSKKEARAKILVGAENLSKCDLRIHWPEELGAVAEHFEKIPRGEHFWKELNLFARRLKQLDEDGRKRLNGAWAIHRPVSMSRAIGLTYHLDEIVMAEDIYTAEDFGRFMVEEELVDVPEDAESCLDFEKIGAEYMADNACAIVNGIYYEDLNPEIKVIYEGLAFSSDTGSEPSSAEPKVIASVFLQNQVLENGDLKRLDKTLELPAKRADVEEAMWELRMRHNTENGSMWIKWKEPFSSLVLVSDEYQNPSNLRALNRITQRLGNLTPDEHTHFSLFTSMYMSDWSMEDSE